MKYTDEELILRLQILGSRLGRTPRDVDLASPDVYYRRFGSLNNALTLAGFVVNRASPQAQELRPCLVCTVETTNPKFCSQSCAATHNNRVRPKRERRQYYCSSCSRPVSYLRKFCDQCLTKAKDVSQLTIGQIRQESTSYHSRHTRVRHHARAVYEASGRASACEVCGYENHYEICHLQAIADFPDTATLAEVNDPANLIALCPNCHWELDHGMLQLDRKAGAIGRYAIPAG